MRNKKRLLISILRYRQTGASSWTTTKVSAPRTKLWITGLATAHPYEWQMKAVCQYGTSAGTAWTSVQSFTTTASNKLSRHTVSDAASEATRASIYPNPSSGILNVVVPISGSYDIAVVNALGQQVLQLRQVTGTFQQLELTAKGMYFVRISADNYSDVQRVVVK